ncbi:hypothetical protein KSP35_11950 [Aquihabitans sp. G128]|uniref:hypothetical protein n=1 Tax=Aquihabitans sp. G128 TaxID=2849779 RepID=UPI001C234A32|nr:hypothetical protein [Aquihabitans sp. G128]QXC59128.1 hypothetical protein KSP35_11950 [Aquihabitans sp. G128]
MTGTGPVRVVAYVPDLMDRSKLARLGAVEVVHVARPDDLAAVAVDGDLVVVDLSRPGAVAALGAIAGQVVGFASHVDTDLIAAARAAGCGEVLPRSRFFATLAERL